MFSSPCDTRSFSAARFRGDPCESISFITLSMQAAKEGTGCAGSAGRAHREQSRGPAESGGQKGLVKEEREPGVRVRASLSLRTEACDVLPNVGVLAVMDAPIPWSTCVFRVLGVSGSRSAISSV